MKSQILKYSRQDSIGELSPYFDKLLDWAVENGVYPSEQGLRTSKSSIIKTLSDYRTKHNINDVVIGMSGGVDSALTAAMFKESGYRVWGFTLPIHQNPDETERGIEACRALDIAHKQIDLTEAYEQTLARTREFDPEIDNDDAKLRRGNLRVRLRMMTLYNMASAVRGFVASTDNFSELAAGFWTLHGDVGDVAPIQSMTKSWEVPKLAELMGVPSSTVFAKPTDGLGISDGDEAQFGFSYLEFDLVLMKLCRATNLFDRADVLRYLNSDTTDVSKVSRIVDRISNSSFKRNNPYNLPHPFDGVRYSGLSELDKILHTK